MASTGSFCRPRVGPGPGSLLQPGPLRSGQSPVPRPRIQNRLKPLHRPAALKQITDSSFEVDVLKSELPVLVECWASWCGPCKLVGPNIERVAAEYEGVLDVATVDTGANAETVRRLKVYGLPSIMLFRGGEEVRDSRREGGITYEGLVEYLNRNQVWRTRG